MGFSNLHDGKMCYPEEVSFEITENDNIISEEDPVVSGPDDETKDLHLMTNILIIAGVTMIVILICIIGLIRQCRQCVLRMFCLDKCCRSSYNVSTLEGRRRLNLESQAATHSSNASDCRSSNSSNISSLLQY